MLVNKEKSSAYLKYKRSQSGITYAKITELSGVPGATLSAYFNGTVQSPGADTFARLMAAVGGSWEEYDAWQPEGAQDLNNAKDGNSEMKLLEIVESLRQAYEANAVRLEASYNASVAQLKKSHDEAIARSEETHAKVLRTHKMEKYVLFALLIAVSVYAVFAFTHYDLPDPTSGVTSLFQ